MSTTTEKFTADDLRTLITACRGFVGRHTLHEKYARDIADAIDRNNPFLEEYPNGERIELRSKAFHGDAVALAELGKKTDQASKKDLATVRLAHLGSVILAFEKGAQRITKIAPDSQNWGDNSFKTKIDTALDWVTACNAGEQPDMGEIMHHNTEASVRNAMAQYLTPAFEVALRKLQHTSPAELKTIATEMAKTPDTYTFCGQVTSVLHNMRTYLGGGRA